ncbi:hypothetical protein HUJ04_008555 [Dendroctonus ponderosae]|nr:hypothetical protein HUJ04_008555 [Dendroctonus ponderosae]KAH1008461.1 hypothetical protein HUJ05_009015 [Dendroctonus ponderosae]
MATNGITLKMPHTHAKTAIKPTKGGIRSIGTYEWNAKRQPDINVRVLISAVSSNVHTVSSSASSSTRLPFGVVSVGAVRCPKCQKLYKNARTMLAHLHQDCGKEKAHNCNFCTSRFKRRHNLKTHIIRRHMERLCECAGRVASFSSSSQSQRVSHRLCFVGKFICPTCYKEYKEKRYLVRHVRYECGNKGKFYCPMCQNNFKRRYRFLGHRCKVPDEK